MRKYLCFLLFCILGLNLICANPYDVNNIPAKLLENASAVVRVDEGVFEINSISQADYTTKYAVTILNRNADREATVLEFYDKMTSIDYLWINLYDSNGKLIRKVKSSEIEDYSAVGGYTLYADDRIKYFAPHVNTYPYTIEVLKKESYKGVFFYPSWTFIQGYNKSVEKSSFKVIVPEDLSVNRIKLNTSIKEDAYRTKKDSVFYWSVEGLKALEKKAFTPTQVETLPRVVLAPKTFKTNGVTGELNSWESFGAFFGELYKGTDELSEETKNRLLNEVASIESQYDKIKYIYEYLQSKTRYVSIQIGIGGWKPYPASIVDEVGYGDCKALSNYMYAMLKAVGIKSHIAIVRAGDMRYINTDFPSNQFNHAILCVPNDGDTLWLECTSQTMPFAYIGDFTDDREVLILTEDGGKLVHTKVYSQQENIQQNKAIFDLSENGDAHLKLETSFKGLQYSKDIVQYLIHYSHSKQEQRDYLNKTLPITHFRLNEFEFYDQKTRIPEAKLVIDLNVQKYAPITGKRLFLPINVLNKKSYKINPDSERKEDFFYDYCYHSIDTVIFELPSNIKVEYLPDNVELESEIGTYKSSIKYENNQITYIRSQKMNKGRFPADRYPEFVEFFKKINKADNLKAVLTQAL